MSEKSFDSSGGELISESEATEYIIANIDNWDFKEKSAEANVWFAYHIAKFTSYLFRDRMNELLAGYSGLVKENRRFYFNGEYAPDSLRPFLMHDYEDEITMTNENTISMAEKPEYIFEGAIIPGWQELCELPMSQMIDKIVDDPKIIDGIQYPKITALTDTIEMSFEAGDDLGWGLDYKITPQTIDLAVFGKKGCTFAATEYVTSSNNNKSMHAKTVAQFIKVISERLGHKDDAWIDPTELEKFYLWITGEERPPIDNSKIQPPHGLQNFVIERLIELGYIKTFHK